MCWVVVFFACVFVWFFVGFGERVGGFLCRGVVFVVVDLDSGRACGCAGLWLVALFLEVDVADLGFGCFFFGFVVLGFVRVVVLVVELVVDRVFESVLFFWGDGF